MGYFRFPKKLSSRFKPYKLNGLEWGITDTKTGELVVRESDGQPVSYPFSWMRQKCNELNRSQPI